MDGTGESSTVGMNQGWREGWLAKLKHNHCFSERKPRRSISSPGIYYRLLESPEGASFFSGLPMDHG